MTFLVVVEIVELILLNFKFWPALVVQWNKSLATMRLAFVATRLRWSGFNSRLQRLVGTCRSTKCIFRD